MDPETEECAGCTQFKSCCDVKIRTQIFAPETTLYQEGWTRDHWKEESSSSTNDQNDQSVCLLGRVDCVALRSNCLIFWKIYNSEATTMGLGETILLKNGWREGKGLGPDLSGRVDPISVSVKLDRSVHPKWIDYYVLSTTIMYLAWSESTTVYYVLSTRISLECFAGFVLEEMK